MGLIVCFLCNQDNLFEYFGTGYTYEKHHILKEFVCPKCQKKYDPETLQLKVEEKVLIEL